MLDRLSMSADVDVSTPRRGSLLDDGRIADAGRCAAHPHRACNAAAPPTPYRYPAYLTPKSPARTRIAPRPRLSDADDTSIDIRIYYVYIIIASPSLSCQHDDYHFFEDIFLHNCLPATKDSYTGYHHLKADVTGFTAEYADYFDYYFASASSLHSWHISRAQAKELDTLVSLSRARPLLPPDV